MKTKHIAVTAALFVGPFLAVVAQPAHAITATADLELLGFSDSILSHSGDEPTINQGSISTSNAGSVTTITYPYTFDLTQGVSQSPTNPLFVVEPQNSMKECSQSGCPTDTATIQVTLNFKYNGVAYNLVEDVDFSATLPDTDSLNWVGGIGTGGNGVYDFTIDGQNFQITLDAETDWNMAQFDGVAYAGPATVPEPASLALLGSALAGFGWLRRRKKVA